MTRPSARTGVDPAPQLGMGPIPQYAVPDPERGLAHGYSSSPVNAWAPSLTPITATGIPDPARTQQIPLRDYRPTQGVSPSTWWLGPQGPGGAEKIARHGVEFHDHDGWEELKGTRPTRPNPYQLGPVPEARPTQQMSPSNDRFTRPYDVQLGAKRLNGQHFSMADHRRNYPILGMRPPTMRRNTYRVDPAPWDADIVDLPPTTGIPTQQRLQSWDIPPSGNASWRLP